MNKKVIIIVLVSVLLLAAVGTSVALAVRGVNKNMRNDYNNDEVSEAFLEYREALKNTYLAENMSAKVKACIIDNDDVLFDSEADIKADFKGSMYSGYFTIADEEEKELFSLYVDEGDIFIKAQEDNVYMLYRCDEHYNRHQAFLESRSNKAIRIGETGFNFLFGEFNECFFMEELSDGTKEIEFSAKGMKLPWPLRVAARRNAHDLDFDFDFDHSGRFKVAGERFEIDIPELTRDVEFKDIDLTALINEDGLIKEQTLSMLVAGKDRKGEEHYLVFNVEIELTNINNTQPEKLDVKNKDIKKMGWCESVFDD